MKILIETSGGGGVVLIVLLALIAGHGGGIGAALLVVVVGLVVLVVAAVIGLAVYLARRARQESPSARGLLPVVRLTPEPGELAGPPRAIDAPVRLDPDQLEQLAELIRRGERQK